MNEGLKKWIKRIVLLVVDLAIAGAIAYGRFQNPPTLDGSISIFHALSDGFFVVGFLNFGLSLLVLISATGFFDIFGFAFKAFLNFFIPRSILEREDNYYEYKVKKAEKRKQTVTFRAMLVIGVAMMLLGILFNVLVYV